MSNSLLLLPYLIPSILGKPHYLLRSSPLRSSFSCLSGIVFWSLLDLSQTCFSSCVRAAPKQPILLPKDSPCCTGHREVIPVRLVGAWSTTSLLEDLKQFCWLLFCVFSRLQFAQISRKAAGICFTPWNIGCFSLLAKTLLCTLQLPWQHWALLRSGEPCQAPVLHRDLKTAPRQTTGTTAHSTCSFLFWDGDPDFQSLFLKR